MACWICLEEPFVQYICDLDSETLEKAHAVQADQIVILVLPDLYLLAVMHCSLKKHHVS